MLRRSLLITFIISLCVFCLILIGCGTSAKETATAKTNPNATHNLGTEDNPIKMAMVPSLDTKKLVKSGEKLAELLEKETGLKYEISVPPSYTAVITAMGAGKVDVGWLSPLPYVIAHDQYGVDVILTTIRDNSPEYWSYIIAHKDAGITDIESLNGKKFAYGDPMSTSGCLYAKHLLRSKGYDPEKFFSQVIYAGAHDRVVMAVYNRQVDAGAIYGGVTSDAREKVIEMLPDVMDKTFVVAKSAEIPNDTVSVRKGLPEDIVAKVRDGLLKIAESDEGRIAVLELYGIDGFIEAKDSDYDSVREVAKAENIGLEQLDKK